MDIQDYTPSVGRQLRIKSGTVLGYSLILLGLGIFIPIRYNIYSTTDEYGKCQFGDLKTNIYIIAVGNLFVGLILAIGSAVHLAAIQDWSRGVISAREYWHDYHREYNGMLTLILFVLQLSVVGFASSNIFRVFDPCGCDPYLYYVLLVNVDIFYNIVLIGCALYLSGYLVVSILRGLYHILRGYFQSCCGDDFIRLMGHFGLVNRGRVGRQRQILPIAGHGSSSHQITITPAGTISLPATANNNVSIPRIIPKLVELGTAEDCAVCIEPQKTGVGFAHCSHWVCEVCWSQIMNTNPVCPLCRAQIV